MKAFTYESAKENFDEMMEHARDGKHVMVKGKDGRILDCVSRAV